MKWLFLEKLTFYDKIIVNYNIIDNLNEIEKKIFIINNNSITNDVWLKWIISIITKFVLDQ